MTKTKGFTIIELLVVCMIIAILTLIVVINLDRSEKIARDTERKSNLTKLTTALEVYRVDTKAYPRNCAGPTCTVNFQSITHTTLGLTGLVSGNYLPVLPSGPQSDDVYKYTSDGNQYKITILSEIIQNDTSADDARKHAGEFFDRATNCRKCFQISSSNSAGGWIDSRCVVPVVPAP